MNYQIKRDRRRAAGTRNLLHNNPYPKAPAWIDKLREGEIYLDIEDALPMYNIYVMLRLRNISRAQLAKHMGLTKQRVHSMMLEGGESHARIESAITAITDSRHTCDGPRSCAVYSASGMDHHQARKLAEAMKQEKLDHPEDWSFEDEAPE